MIRSIGNITGALFIAGLGLLAHASPARAADPSGLADAVLVADFEAETYGDWTVTGKAFGPAPALGALPGQMAVEGFLGKRLVNSFTGGDASTGTLTSRSFKIERKAINFLIGGGKSLDGTFIELIVDGKSVRRSTGPNDSPGGSERLAWKSWDVREFVGKMGTVRIVDDRKGGWGHINVDHIVQSDDKLEPEPVRRELIATARYLLLPVKNGAPKQRMTLTLDGKIIREFEIELAEGPGDFQVFADLGAYQGKTIVAATDSGRRKDALAGLVFSETLPNADGLYKEACRPQFHFTSRRGWLNDPNGLVFHKGKYHLFYQHNPYGREWGNMHWGHAISDDLVRWKELPVSVYPYKFGDWAFSGSAISLDGDIIAAFTSTGRGECLLRSKDEGLTWTEFPGNPAVKHEGRDPKLVWHEPTKQWIMALYDEYQNKRMIAFHGSADLRTWKFLSRIDGFFECPDLFEAEVQGEPGARRWVLYAADGKYVIGQFDGKDFHAEPGKHQLWFGNFYAAQTYANVPDGRHIQIGWANGMKYPGMPFNQQMTVATELTLRKTPDGIRMFGTPVKEIASLRGSATSVSAQTITRDHHIGIEGVWDDVFELNLSLKPGEGSVGNLKVRGLPIQYDAAKRTLQCGTVSAPLEPVDGKISLKILVDRASVEVFANDGRVAMSVGFTPAAKDRSVELSASKGSIDVSDIKVYELRSIWTR